MFDDLLTVQTNR